MERLTVKTRQEIETLLNTIGFFSILEREYPPKQRTFEEIEKGPPEKSQEYCNATDGAYDAVRTISEIVLTDNKNKPIKKMIETYRLDFDNQNHPYWNGFRRILEIYDGMEIWDEAKKSFETIDDIRNNLDIICSEEPTDLL